MVGFEIDGSVLSHVDRAKCKVGYHPIICMDLLLGADPHHMRKNCDLEVKIFAFWR